tara:strand:+ start:334 stop:3687 length:3354 start_codon:yes stop_codon:yes gene_type:complete
MSIPVQELDKVVDVIRQRTPERSLNENLTYGSLLNDDALRLIAINTYVDSQGNRPFYNAMVEAIGQEDLDMKIAQAEALFKRRFDARNFEPIDYNVQQRHPVYYEKLQRYNDPDFIIAEQQRRNLLSARGNLDSYVDIKPPSKPIGFDKSIELAKYGIDSAVQYDAPGFTRFRLLQALGGPRTKTPEDLNYAKNYMGLDSETRQNNPGAKGPFADIIKGDFGYVDPSRPELGTAIFEEGKRPVLWDSPQMTPIDPAEFVLQEGPTFLGEILGMKYAGKVAKDEFLEKVPKGSGIAGKIKDSVFYNVLLGGGAAAADFTQKMIGLSYGAHDRSVTDLMKESGLLFVFASIGNLGIDFAMNGIPKLYRAIKGRDIGATELKELEEAFAAFQASKRGVKQKTMAPGTPEEITLLDIDTAIESLADKIGDDVMFNPTLAQGTKNEFVANLEQIFNTNSSNPEFSKFYQEMLKGNKEVEQKFFNALFDKLDNSITGETVGRDLLKRIDLKRDSFLNEGELIIDGFTKQINDIKDLIQGKGVLSKVIDEQASSNLYTRQTSKIDAAAKKYRADAAQSLDDAFEEFGLNEIKTNSRAGGFRDALIKFRDYGKGGDLFKGSTEQVKRRFNDFFDEATAERLLRYTDGDLSIGELNRLRIDLNAFRADLAKSSNKPADVKIFNVVSDLQKKLENNIYAIASRNLSVGEAAKFQSIFQAQKAATELANKEIVLNISKQQPEGLVSYLFNQNIPGATTNTKVKDFVEFLKVTDNVDDLKIIRNDIIDYMQKTFFDETVDKTLKRAENYRQFVTTNQGVLREIFDEDQFTKLFPSFKNFNKEIIEPLKVYDQQIEILNKTYGDGVPYNIVSRILGTGNNPRAAGEVARDIDFVLGLLKLGDPKDNKILQDEVAQATKKYIKQRIQTDGEFDVFKLNNFLNEGFADGMGDALSFDGTFGKLLGDGADEFLKNMKVLRDIGMRVNGDLLASGPAGLKKQIEENISNPQIHYLKRFFIPPLTQTGRRITAGENLIKDRNSEFLSELIRDPELFKSFTDALRTRKGFNEFLRFAQTHHRTVVQDVGSQAENYDPDKKQMRERADTFSEELLERSILENGLDYTIEQLQDAGLL